MRAPNLLSLLLGAVAALGFAPLELWPLTLLALAGWLMLVHAAPTWRAAAWRGWAFGVGHFAINNNWIQHAFDFQDAMPPVLGYIAPLALALYLAVFPTIAALIAWRFRGERPDTGFALAAGAAWIASEWLRSWLFTGYIWDPVATIWVPVPLAASGAAWIGTYALGGVTVMIAGLLLLLVQGRWQPIAAAVSLAIPLLVAGSVIANPPITQPTYPADYPRLVVVQPNIGNDQRLQQTQERTLAALIRLSGRLGPAPRLVVWPEGLVYDLLESGYPDGWYAGRPAEWVRARIARVLGARDMLMTNATTLAFDKDGELAGAGNSVLAIAPKGALVGRYDKAHLVPYGEYLPMPWLLKPLGLEQLVPGGMDFTPGPGPRNIDVPGIGAVGIQVCYEIIFSGQVVDRASRPRLLFNPSNDAWFGAWGPPQHLAQARLRAIEEGLPIVRATPTGISAVIGADGALLAQIPLGKAAAIEVPLPRALAPTLFSRLGNWLALIVAGLLAAGAVALRRRAR
ncbi:apolipoprotein N-acyltransferase [Sphingomonas sp.]|uniref:apolipoprotein N-acyltransferase n=1 Tax=Sphingomonas sp. TaxID=28214 RepID=UPI002D7F4ED0|nr:apolipoprotein N-acyltransferase [Sphingomonas sp.]HEU0044137.1 apolipoprotein N-acyltransferase [Sphingomonas sp.]